MTPTEAQDLATRISQTWRGGPQAHIWEEELIDLDHGRAGTAYARLRREAEHAPTIARFHATYRAIRTEPANVEHCSQCDSTGWERARDHITTDANGDEHRTSQVAPCRHCDIGSHAQRVWSEIRTHNSGGSGNQ